MQLRVNGETEEDEIRSEPLPEPSDLITDEDVFPEDRIEGGEEQVDDEDAGRFPGLPGPVIAASTFVPTFLAVFFGLSYLLGPQTGPMASAPVPSASRLMSDMGTPGTPPRPEALRDPFVAPRTPDSPSTRPSDSREATRPSDSREAPRGPSAEDTPTPPVEQARPAPAIEQTRPAPPVEQTRPALAPTLPPTPPPALPPAQPRAGRLAEPPRQQPQAAVLNTTPERTPVPRTSARDTSGREWTPAAAFADRDAAGRLASSIQQQGYPVEIRQEQSSSRPWVVWIGAQPRGGERRR
ncbi:MAG TPA: hypothetical protein VK547_09855 [Candidatus Udaeobacter sp.]|nr:hypothetical protein [Candidatus Udaeobacter sp.]